MEKNPAEVDVMALRAPAKLRVTVTLPLKGRSGAQGSHGWLGLVPSETAPIREAMLRIGNVTDQEPGQKRQYALAIGL